MIYFILARGELLMPKLTDKPKETLSWNDLLNSSKTSDHEKEAIHWIKSFIGYVPDRHIYLPRLAFIQALIANNINGIMSNNELFEELEYHAKEIRNRDMKEGGWVQCENPDAYDIDQYENYLPLYKDIARIRLSDMLGYEPEFKYSADAQTFLRQLFTLDHFYNTMPYGDVDLKAATIVRYREAYFLEGEKAADDSELLGLRMGMILTQKEND